MHSKKLRLGVVGGGSFAVLDVSLTCAASIIDALDTDKYEIHVSGIDKNGAWRVQDKEHTFLNIDDPKMIQLGQREETVSFVARPHRKEIVSSSTQRPLELDVIFPILHGTYGEDGTLQGLLKLAQIPFVGAGVLGSAVGMDKDVMKRLLCQAGIPTARFLVVHRH